MKKFIFIFLVTYLISTNYSNCQNSVNPYQEFNSEDARDLFGDPYPGYPPYDGEYIIYLNNLYWLYGVDLASYFKFYKIEVVSFPFIPQYCVDLNGSINCSSPYTDRSFDVLSDDYINENIENYIASGSGWSGNNHIIFKFINPTPSPTIGDLNCLISGSFNGDLLSQNRVVFPHTILKHTLYFSNSDNINDIIDSLSWVYDNTRGRMKSYPFTNYNSGFNPNCGPYAPTHWDVTFGPLLRINEEGHTYNENSNLEWYGEPNEETINYYPIPDCYYTPPLCDPIVYPGNLLEIFLNNYSHPPSYSLFDAPLLNSQGSAYAGYNNDGVYDDCLDVEDGIEHVYDLSESIDLRKINPSEKIIYNPSELFISPYGESNTLVFPSWYKFLTVHGRYPDKADVIAANNEIYNRCNNLADVIVPTDLEWSEYTVASGSKLYIEPCVIIMDAVIYVYGTLEYDPTKTYGNFVIITEGQGKIIKYFSGQNCFGHIPDIPDFKTINYSTDIMIYKLNIYPNPAKDKFIIEYTIPDKFHDASIKIVNSLGIEVKIIKLHSESNKIEINSGVLQKGIYSALLFFNNKVVNSKKFVIE